MHYAQLFILSFSFSSLLWASPALGSDAPAEATGNAIEVATFDVDATPPLGNWMAYQPVRRLDEMTLRCRGVVLRGAGDPIVLCAVDWIGIANGGHDAFREALAEAAETTPERVAVHCVHQHDAPLCDFTAEELLQELEISGFQMIKGDFAREVIQRTVTAIRAASDSFQPVTHVGWGVSDVEKVASNRRILGADGKVRATRYTTTKDPQLRAEPDGVIDPQVSLLSLWNDDQPVAVLSYYACHPQSYYLTGIPSPDFPGIARFIRGQAVPEALHIHFNGAGGNIGAGKYNDGAKANRMILANRLAAGMKQAFDSTRRVELDGSNVGWEVTDVQLPAGPHLIRRELIDAARSADARRQGGQAVKLAWLERCRAGVPIEISCLRMGQVRVLHMPGELFVEYQLAAKAMRPDLHVAMAAYGNYGPGYIGTAVAYGQGGYETSDRATGVGPRSEPVLMSAIEQLLE